MIKPTIINIPTDVRFILSKLIDANYEAYVVGGCVRDSLLKVEPKDWDITTNALPEQIKQVFIDHEIINNNGEKHGTVTIRYNNENYEITTYRTETTYTDHRHPDTVSFVGSLKEDLARRDLTINAMAANVNGEVIDYFNGQTDLSQRIISCVGNPLKRFDEDALRILRAMRFAARFNADISVRTLMAMLLLRSSLHMISAERIRDELIKMVSYRSFTNLMRTDAKLIIAEVIPELLPMMFDTTAITEHQRHNSWEHALIVMDGVDEHDYILRLVALLHDVWKYPSSNHRTTLARILEKLKFSTKDIIAMLWLNEHIVDPIYHIQDVKTLMNNTPENMLYLVESLAKLKKAHIFDIDEIFSTISPDMILAEYNRVLTTNECYSLKQLAINGNDLLALGVTGKQIGSILNECLYYVIENGETFNIKEILINFCRENYCI